MKSIVYIFICASLLIMSCSKDSDIAISSSIDKGVFVANQGKFPDGNGAVSWIKDEKTQSTDIFSALNGGRNLGNTVQSVFYNNRKYFIAVNNAGEIEVTDENFKSIKTITNAGLPRYFAAWGEKTLVSSWDATSELGSILVLNENNNIEFSFKIKGAPEKMMVKNDQLWITHSNGFHRDSVISVYDLNNFSLLKSFNVTMGPNSFVVDNIGNVLVLCEGYFDWVTNQPYPGAIFKLDLLLGPEMLMELPQGSSNLCYHQASNTLYFNDFSSIYKFKISDLTYERLEILPTTSTVYGLAIDEPNNILYYSDPKDFASQGSLIAINLITGSYINFPAGIVPGQIFIRN